MKNAKKWWTLLSIVIVVALFFTVVYYAMSFSANAAMRRTIFLHGHPILAVTASLPHSMTYQDKKYGDCYDISDATLADGTENSIPGICMKKGKFGMYDDITIGIYRFSQEYS